ncbi:MAG: 2-C-methyl-D-erythritol 2,4-cyclodiphosphate synthase, partial [Betaproteobacteria bacterium]|nr:2-C-methyl-D-erythritol 2,4-cyclodiphosphate synthase [Betaproteobacteria bacterium]
PDDQRWRGADSIELLQKVTAMLADEKWRIENIDSTIVAQAPKFAGHRNAMRSTIATACRIEMAQVSVKATTAEGMGMIGAGEGIAAYAVAMISGSASKES